MIETTTIVVKTTMKTLINKETTMVTQIHTTITKTTIITMPNNKW